MKKVEQLYSSSKYISQQTMAIDQALSQINMDAENNNLNENILSPEDVIQKLEEITANGVDN
ncbi:MAG: hypothetical protein BWY04_00580 [candidate division CPR1 bacterium ADurb.Bin160]|jgi:hypothetical protein|uniref:Uncharacterized protein n=1 Tax=candidate division CPR1 bacterium ADurb.Bin160 TaxID=1852826 RepID=A0A1V5ZNM9_9BACT|nr:MAG: hypothetical protein BWY04_00580 [candidate division CPR1 bacterium ADurb.Bin160]